MGTNFYRRGKLTKEQAAKFKQSIDENDYKAIDYFYDICKEVHIGKSSGGWKFLWDAHYFNYFEPNKQSILNWLKEGVIFDEYNKEYTFEQFMDFLKERDIPFNQHDVSTYEHYCTVENLPQSHYVRDTRFFKWFTDRYGIKVDIYGEFYIEDMRFTVDSNFC